MYKLTTVIPNDTKKAGLIVSPKNTHPSNPAKKGVIKPANDKNVGE